MLNDVLAQKQFSWWSFRNLGTNLCADFLQTQILGDNLSNRKIFHVQLIFDHLNSQVTITTHHLLHPLLTTILLVEGLPLLESSFTSSNLPLNLLFNSETCVHNVVLSLSTYWSISSVCDTVFPNQKCQVYSLLGVHCSFVRAPSWTTWKKSRCKQHVKKYNGCRKLRLHSYTPKILC